MDSKKSELVLKAAILYYEEMKTQNEIAKELNISRSYVSQLLNHARKTGIVKISIQVDEFGLRMIKREIEFKRLFPSLQQVYIMRSDSEDFTANNLGKFAAPYITEFINNSKIIGINPGLSVERTIRHLKNQGIQVSKEHKVVPLMGGIDFNDNSPYAHPNEITKELGEVLNCEYFYLNCPAVIEQRNLRDQLIKERSISEVIKLWDNIDLAIMGLGVADERSKLFKLFGEKSRRKIIKSGAVGVINISYFDENGNFIPLYEDHKIGITIDKLKKIPKKVVICSGKFKARALIGALKGSFINILITDSLTADEVERYKLK